MDIFHDMRRFRTGRDEDGIEHFQVPLKPDEDGLIGRECPNENCDPRYFKISLELPEQGEPAGELSQLELVCPYCGTGGHMQDFNTKAQLDWIMSMVFRDAARAVYDTLKRAFRPHRQGLISIKVERGSLPSVRHYVEERLKQTVTCSGCQHRYAVYGLSFHCPWCGQGAIAQHLSQSVSTIRVLADEAERIGQTHGRQAEERMYGNAYEDVVSLFEGFLKMLYRYAVRKRFSPEEAEKKLDKVKVNFQRLAGAQEFLAQDLGVAIFSSLTADERGLLERVFAKRHVLTHNLGLVDDKYREQVRTWERRGSEVPMSREEIQEATELVCRVIREAASALGLATVE